MKWGRGPAAKGENVGSAGFSPSPRGGIRPEGRTTNAPLHSAEVLGPGGGRLLPRPVRRADGAGRWPAARPAAGLPARNRAGRPSQQVRRSQGPARRTPAHVRLLVHENARRDFELGLSASRGPRSSACIPTSAYSRNRSRTWATRPTMPSTCSTPTATIRGATTTTTTSATTRWAPSREPFAQASRRSRSPGWAGTHRTPTRATRCA